MNSNWSELPSFFFTAMVIGFTQRVRKVSESDVTEGEDLLLIDINVAAQRENIQWYSVFNLVALLLWSQ